VSRAGSNSDESFTQSHLLTKVSHGVLAVLLRMCTSTESGMPPCRCRLQRLHASGLLAMASLLDVCSIYATTHLSGCQAVAQACWASTDMAGAY
jgi:hypothetical protein